MKEGYRPSAQRRRRKEGNGAVEREKSQEVQAEDQLGDPSTDIGLMPRGAETRDTFGEDETGWARRGTCPEGKYPRPGGGVSSSC